MDDADHGFPPAPPRRVWTFGACTFDEARWALSVDGRPVEIEAKPLEILLELLRHAGEMVTKAELLDAVWPGVMVVEGSLTTAVSKLRKALGPEGDRRILTVPRLGYRLDGPVTVKAAPAASGNDRPALAVGDTPPQRPNWRLEARLGASPRGEVWRARHAKTQEARVFKFAADGDRLRGLRREVALSRLLREGLGERPDLVPVLDWDFSAPPFFIESADGGPDLPTWAQAQGGLSGVPLQTRIALLASVAETMAAAHALGVLHRDLKPANVLVPPDGEGGWRPRVVDFGSADLSDLARLQALDITHTAFGAPPGGSASSGGTSLWIAPELLDGGAAGTGADVYALGVILYQLVVGDLRRPLAAGWEAEVADALLREDIAAAAAGDPARRLAGASELARRLRSLDDRRRARAEAQAAAARAELAERRLEQARARRPWAMAAVAALALGVLATTALYLRAEAERDRARRQTAVAEKVDAFLARDLLARASPFRSASSDESLVGAVKVAAPLIDRRFADEPAIAARLHQTIANALDKRSDWPDARAQYERAAALWGRVEGGSADVAAARLQQAMMEARSYEAGSVARARALVALAAPVARAPGARADLGVWLASAEGMVALVGDDARGAAVGFGRAVEQAERLDGFDPQARLTFRQRLAFAQIRLGDGAGAERQFRELDRRFRALEGPDGPDVLMVGMNIAQALMIQGRHAAAVAQANAVEPRLVARLGADHEMVLQLRTTRAQSEGVLEQFDDAIRDDLAVHAVAVRKQGAKSFFAVASLSDAATAQCRSGRAEEGVRNAAAAHEAARAGFGKAALTDAVGYALAACLIAAGRPAEAPPLLEGIDRAAVVQLAGDPNWGANVDLALAQAAFARGDLAETRRRLDLSGKSFAAPTAEPFQVRAWRGLDARVTAARQ